MKRLMSLLLVLILLPRSAGAFLAHAAPATASLQPLPFAQNWSNTTLIIANDDWSGVPGIPGYRADDLPTAIGVDPQTVLADGTNMPVDVNANRTDPNTFINGGLAEFELADPTIALNGSVTADAPFLLLHLNTAGFQSIQVSYKLRDLDGSADNATQPVALHFRAGATGAFANVPAGYVADATTGPSLATLVTLVSATLPPAADNQAELQVRMMTTNAPGNDEWVGVDDIQVAGTPSGGDQARAVVSTTPAAGATGLAPLTHVVVNFSEPVTFEGDWFDVTCAVSGRHTGAAIAGGLPYFEFVPQVDFAPGEQCTVTLRGAQVHDVDMDEPPDTMAADYIWSFTVAAECGEPCTAISAVQGASTVSPMVGAQVTVEGTVLRDFASAGQFWAASSWRRRGGTRTHSPPKVSSSITRADRV